MFPATPFLAAKCYWPGVTERAVALAAARGAAEAEAVSRAESAVGYLGSMLFPDDELVLCLFDAPSSAAVRQLAERASIPCERVMNAQWMPAPRAPAESVHGGWPSPLDLNNPSQGDLEC